MFLRHGLSLQSCEGFNTAFVQKTFLSQVFWKILKLSRIERPGPDFTLETRVVFA